MSENLNLTPERGPNVWDRKPGADRWKSEVGGAVMVAAGAAAAFVGGRMIYRALRRGPAHGRIRPGGPTDIVGEESDQSFPASDAPSWTSVGAEADQHRQ